ncbi:MIP aquaporin-like protein [Fragilaria crotonensis]|nr:MIP aquaporin-like protein [Fragilaria crotonensis]
MIRTLVETLSQLTKDVFNYIPPGVFVAFAAAFLVEGKYFKQFRQEFVGTFLMIACTFSAGKWVGKDSIEVAWTAHFLGVIAADYFGGGPHVNPAVTLSMFCLGKASYTEAYIQWQRRWLEDCLPFPSITPFQISWVGPHLADLSSKSWNVFEVGTSFEFPSDMDHYIVYWLAPGLSSILASIVYVVYAGGTVFGAKIPLGPLKKQTPAREKTKKKKN